MLSKDFSAQAADDWERLAGIDDPGAVELANLLDRTAAAHRESQVRALRPFRSRGITGPADYRHLALLYRRGASAGMTMTQQSDELHTKPGTISKRLARFESLGLVDKAPDALDARSYLWNLSDSGKNLVVDAFAAMYETYRASTKGISDAQRAVLIKLLRRLD